MSSTVLLLTFVLLLLCNVPIAISIGLATLATMLFTIDFVPAVTTIAQRMGAGLDSFTLLAIPFFILSGQLMARGGIARRLVNAAKVVVGMLPGGLSFVNTLSCMLFGSISGSAVATTSAIGSFMIPEMKKMGYKAPFAGALTAAASTTGMLIPPSNTLIVYAVASGGVSISALFMGGYLPGILLGLALMMVCAMCAFSGGLPKGERSKASVVLRKIAEAIPSLLLIFIVIGGILAGIFTATEAGAIAVVYALFLAVVVYREIKITELPSIFLRSVEVMAVVMFLIATSMALAWMLAYENIPQIISQTLLALSDNPLVILLLMNLILLLVGAFLDITPAILIFTPIFLPVVMTFGMSPLHFGIMLIMNLSIGLCTPPVGSVLFVGCVVAKTTIAKITQPLIPMFVAMLLVLMGATYIPALSEWLPRSLGLIE